MMDRAYGLIRVLSGVDDLRCAYLLTRLQSILTIAIRDLQYCSETMVEYDRYFVGLMEIVHKFSGNVLACMHRDPRRYPNDVLVGIVGDIASDSGLHAFVEQAFLQTLLGSSGGCFEVEE